MVDVYVYDSGIDGDPVHVMVLDTTGGRVEVYGRGEFRRTIEYEGITYIDSGYSHSVNLGGPQKLQFVRRS